MNFENPEKVGITVYTKTNCIECDKMKGYMQNNKLDYKVIYCDAYYENEEKRKQFLEYMFLLTGHKIRQFPIIFMDGTYIGSYIDLMEYYGDF